MILCIEKNNAKTLCILIISMEILLNLHYE